MDLNLLIIFALQRLNQSLNHRPRRANPEVALPEIDYALLAGVGYSAAPTRYCQVAAETLVHRPQPSVRPKARNNTSRPPGCAYGVEPRCRALEMRQSSTPAGFENLMDAMAVTTPEGALRFRERLARHIREARLPSIFLP